MRLPFLPLFPTPPDDRFRQNFLWGRKPMLAACAARLEGRKDLVWVDLGGGTGENVLMMAEYIPLKNFKKIYVVDLCHSLCEQVRSKMTLSSLTAAKKKSILDIRTKSYALLLPSAHALCPSHSVGQEEVRRSGSAQRGGCGA